MSSVLASFRGAMSKTAREIHQVSCPLPAGTVNVGDSSTAPEMSLLAILVDVVGVERATIDSHFFDELGADSMVMARFCARVRKRPDLPSATIKDVYANPTIRCLAAAISGTSPALRETPEFQKQLAPEAPRWRRSGTTKYVLCGVTQFAMIAAYISSAEAVGYLGWNWISAATDLGALFLRASVLGDSVVVVMCILPIVVKWALIGRWTTREFPVWSLAYVRFWFVKTLVRANPLLLLVGGRSRSNTTSPIINIYLRALGARIGPGVAIFARTLPVCTDLLTIGADTVIRNEALIACYRAHDGRIQTGPVHLGKHAFVGEAAVIDIGASMGDGAQLGHVSSLHTGQVVPDGETWHGCPAQRTDVDYRVVGHIPGARRRAIFFGAGQLVGIFVISVPLMSSLLALAFEKIPQLDRLLDPEPGVLTTWVFYRDASLISVVAVGAALVLGLSAAGTIPRLLNRMIEPDTEYPLYGFHYNIHRAITRLSNNRFMGNLFGDTSYIVHYLRLVGYDLSTVTQTGSNFGQKTKHENPFLITIGSGTMVADGLAILNADFSHTSFRLSRARIGAHSFLGNSIYYPTQSRVGDDCLLASKAMVPVDGPVREGTGLLGSPAFPIPRTVERDKAKRLGRGVQRRRLRAKNRHNIVTMALFLLLRWFFLLSMLVFTEAVSDGYAEWNPLAALVLSGLFYPLWTIVVWAVTERLVTPRLRKLRPQYCSIYDRYFWRHERYWKVNWQDYYVLLNGTPLKNVLWRLLGVRIGRRLFDDGLEMTERSLVTIGDDCTANQLTGLQGHSQEDGAFKSEYITIGSRVTLGPGAWVNYGVTVGDDVCVEPHSYVMKGEEIPSGACWSGNPAVEVREGRHVTSPVRQVTEGAVSA
ncbi:Pls/PosA family non-ribosomal peptide synthetase [Pseudonocardia sp. CA-142604]|uniref:Pls/PosA family non-ribosomal peptide synthetase n=1 Tax=Pseudonocardia sp. CA-142604 TaxID=3240024 RepID=UPI003D8A21E2